MKKMSLFLTTLFLSVAVFAQEVPASDVLESLLALIGGWKTLGAMGAALAIVQLLIKFLNSGLAANILDKLDSNIKFLVIQALSIISAYLTLAASGVSGVEALVKTLAMPLVVEFLHKIYKLYIEKKSA